MYLFIEYPRCTTCKKAKKYLDDNNISYTDRNIKEDNPSYEELKLWISNSDFDIKKYFNTSGLIYKNLNLKNKLDNMSFEEKLNLLSSDGMLVKRPLLIKDNKVVNIGFKEEIYDKIK